jgi:hypothetical protein
MCPLLATRVNTTILGTGQFLINWHDPSAVVILHYSPNRNAASVTNGLEPGRENNFWVGQLLSHLICHAAVKM